MKKIVVALCLCSLLMAGCVETPQHTEDKDNNTENTSPEEHQEQGEDLFGVWNKIEGSTELTAVDFSSDGDAIVYFGCSCPENREEAQWSIVGNYIDIAAESRTQRYIYKLENETLYLRTLTEKTFSTFDK